MASITWDHTNVLVRQPSRPMPVVAHGHGIFLYDTDGKRYLDASSGALVVSVGHGNTELASAIAAQLARVSYVNGTQFTTEPTERAAATLAALASRELAGVGLDRTAFLCSGSEAIEAAVKFCRQVQVERGQAQRTKVIARVPSYHGNTLYSLSLSARPAYRIAYGPLLSTIPTVRAPTAFHAVPPLELSALQAELEALIASEGPQTIAAFIAEPIMGSSGGGAVPPPGYFEAIRALCDANGILFIADEVMCGAGRTGTFFASANVNAKPDVLVLGKGLGGGLAPVSAVMVRGALMEELRRGSGAFAHAQTYLQAPFLTAAADAVLDFFERHALVAHVAETGAQFHQQLRARLAGHPLVGAIQGRGLFAGVELLREGQPFPRAMKVIERVVSHLFERGLIVWPNVGHANGTDGDLFMLGPPLIISREEVELLVDSLGAALDSFTP